MAAPWVLPFHSEEFHIPFDETIASEAALVVIGVLDVARGKEFVIRVPSKGISADGRLRLKP